MSSDRDEAHAFGFHSYADDSPRDDEPAVEGAEPPLAAGWAETPAWRQPDPPDPEPVAWPKVAAAGGAVMGLLAAAAVGWSALRDRPEAPEPSAVATPAAPATAVAKPLEVVVRDLPPPPTPKATERLEVLPRPGAPRPRTSLAEVVIPVVPTGAAPRVVAEAPAAPAPLPPAAPSVTETVREASVRTGPEARRFNDCRDAPSLAYRLVCSDMRLAAADQRMKRAYKAALAAGVPADALRRDQDDWMDVREDAAQVSRRAVADIYRQRTRELYALADGQRD